MTRRFRRRAALLEAMQFDGSIDGAHRLAAFSDAVAGGPDGLRLQTGRGALRIVQGDWLVRDPETLHIELLDNAQFFRVFDHVAAEVAA